MKTEEQPPLLRSADDELTEDSAEEPAVATPQPPVAAQPDVQPPVMEERRSRYVRATRTPKRYNDYIIITD